MASKEVVLKDVTPERMVNVVSRIGIKPLENRTNGNFECLVIYRCTYANVIFIEVLWTWAFFLRAQSRSWRPVSIYGEQHSRARTHFLSIGFSFFWFPDDFLILVELVSFALPNPSRLQASLLVKHGAVAQLLNTAQTSSAEESCKVLGL